MNKNITKKININSGYKKVIFSIAFKYGYLDESNKEYGYSHLVEHYVCSFLEDKIKCNEVYGSIDDNYILINIDFNKRDYNSFSKDFKYEKFKENILNEIDQNIAKNELKRLENEINSRYLYIENEITEEILNKIIKKPKKITRRRKEQIKNLSKFDITTFKHSLKKILNSERVIFIDKDNNKNTVKIKNDDIFINKKEKVEFKKPSKMKLIIDNSAYNKINNLVIGFRGLELDSSTKEKFSLIFLINEIKNKLQNKLEKEGVYDISSFNSIYPNFGIIWFMISGYDNDIKNIFKETVKEVLTDKKIDIKIKKYKKEQAKIIKDVWQDKENRNTWIIEDLLEQGYVIDHKKLITEINNLSKEDLINTKKVLNIENSYIFTNH